jgi:hypothetical protein
MPFALSREEFMYSCNVANGLLLDRYRLLAPGSNQAVWISDETAAKLTAWIEPRIGTLPLLAEANAL